MKKFIVLVMAVLMVFGLTGCNAKKDYSDYTLKVYFVPSRPAAEILTMTAPLADMLKTQLADQGYEVAGVDILVSSTYEAAGEALLAGTGDVGFLPGGTYVAYKDIDDSPVEVILAATRAGLNNDSMDPKDWNDNKPTTGDPDYQVAYYKGLIVAGTSAAARTVADKVNSGAELTWDDVKDLKWCVRSATSSSGYIYPAIWLSDNFDKNFSDISGIVTQTGGYGDTLSGLAAGTCDVGTIYADARRDYADEWTTTYGRPDTIWNETDVIGVTKNIMNDTISVSHVNLDDGIIEAIQQAFLNIAQTDAGLEVMAVYSHQGYTIVTDSDYDGERQAAEIAGE